MKRLFSVSQNSLPCLCRMIALPALPAIIAGAELPVTDFGAMVNDSVLDTRAIQNAIDSCAALGGGIVRFTKGTYLSGSIVLKSKVMLHLDSCALLQGSDDYADYSNDIFIRGDSISDIGIEGKGTIDGVDCYNAHGEEGFRGPHCVVLRKCRNIKYKGFTIQRSANYALNHADCVNETCDSVTILGGHDGIHAQRCSSFTVMNCDFRTGDDSYAGSDNVDFSVIGCKINSSCNGFRFGCQNLTVKRCVFYGPGQYMHRVSKRTNMGAAFVHFAPNDRNPKIPSDNWVIEDITVDSVDLFYGYNIKGTWQTGQPVKTVRFTNVKAGRLLKPTSISGDSARQFRLILTNVEMSFRPGAENQELLNVKSFGAVEFHNVTLTNDGNRPLVVCDAGDTAWLDSIRFVPATNSSPLALTNIKVTRTDHQPVAISIPRSHPTVHETAFGATAGFRVFDMQGNMLFVSGNSLFPQGPDWLAGWRGALASGTVVLRPAAGAPTEARRQVIAR